MTKARDIADGTRYVDVTGDTMTGQLIVQRSTSGDEPYISAKVVNTGTSAGVAFDCQASGGRQYEIQSTTSGSLIFYDRDNSRYVAQIHGDGQFVNDRKPFAFVRVASDQSLTATAVAPYNNVVDSQNLNWNTTNKGFTVPVTGIYQITAALRVENYTGDYLFYHIRANGSPLLGSPHFLNQPKGSGGFGTASVATSIKLTANDFIDFTWSWNGNNPLTIYALQSYVSVALIG